MPDAEIMTSAEVQALLRVPSGTLRYWRSRNEGPRSYRLGGRVVYDRPEVLRWLEEQRAGSSVRGDGVAS